jgi:hypothetical protein
VCSGERRTRLLPRLKLDRKILGLRTLGLQPYKSVRINSMLWIKSLFLMQSLDILLPIILLALAFLLKLFVDQPATVPRTIEVLYCVPVDVIFLATSFAGAFTLSSSANAGRGLLHVVIFIGMAVVIVALWRRSIRYFDLNHYLGSGLLFLLNIGLSSTLLFRAIKLLSEARH